MLTIPTDFPVQPIDREWAVQNAKVPATCGVCHLTWDDGEVTSMTPVPAGRCPFEAFHATDVVELHVLTRDRGDTMAALARWCETNGVSVSRLFWRGVEDDDTVEDE